MIEKIRNVFSPPVLDDDEQSIAANVLYGLIAMVAGVTVFLSFPLAVMAPSGNSSIAIQGVVALAICGLTYHMIRKRAVRWGSILFLGLFFAVFVGAVITGGGVQDSSFMNFILLVIAAGMLLGMRAAIIMTILCALLGLGFLIAEINGLMPEATVVETPFTSWFRTTIIFILVAVMQGISSRTASKVLRDAHKTEAGYRTLVEQIPAITYVDVTAPLGKTEYASPQVAELLGLNPDEWMHGEMHYWLDLVHPDDRDAARIAYVKSTETGVPFDMEYRMVVRGGQTIWVHDKAIALLDSQGSPKWIHGVIIDITEKKQTQLKHEGLILELESKNAEMERFVYTVSHDLKSPIVTIVGFLGFIEDDVKTGNLEAFRKDMDRVYQATFKMQNLMKNLLELSRIGRLMNEPEVVAFSELVDEALELTHGRLQERNVSVHIDPDLPSVHGDRLRLLELVQNLIDNAAKYMGDQHEPLIEIGSKRFEDRMPIFFVRDNGLGIAPEFHDRVFDLFNKLDPQSEGTGIGLALAKRIVEFHGGRIWVESEAGKGAAFYFTLPARKPNL